MKFFFILLTTTSFSSSNIEPMTSRLTCSSVLSSCVLRKNERCSSIASVRVRIKSWYGFGPLSWGILISGSSSFSFCRAELASD